MELRIYFVIKSVFKFISNSSSIKVFNELLNVFFYFVISLDWSRLEIFFGKRKEKMKSILKKRKRKCNKFIIDVKYLEMEIFILLCCFF